MEEALLHPELDAQRKILAQLRVRNGAKVGASRGRGSVPLPEVYCGTWEASTGTAGEAVINSGISKLMAVPFPGRLSMAREKS